MWELGEIGKDITTLHNILQWEKSKEMERSTLEGMGTGRVQGTGSGKFRPPVPPTTYYTV